MRTSAISKHAAGAMLALAGALSVQPAHSQDAAAPTQVTPAGSGFTGVYGTVPPDQVEFLSTPDHILSAAASGAPSLVWEALEHGEKVECLNCIAPVAALLYDSNAKTREIAAWWLRRRVVGVFGAGEVYSQTVQTLQTDPDPVRRSYAANALGEFFVTPGIAACATAVVGDSDPGVRAAAATALGRLNDDGNGALGQAMGDTNPIVSLAALESSARINSFSSVQSISALSGNSSAFVRRRAMEVLDALDATDAVLVAAVVAGHDPDAGTRAAACHALGTFGNSNSAIVSLLTTLSQNDPDPFVRDQAQIALRRL
jgi:HEAT repeat protein